MTYTPNNEIEQRIDFDGEDFYDINPGKKFDDLLTELEKDTRAIINGQIGGATLAEETDRLILSKHRTSRASSSFSLLILFPKLRFIGATVGKPSTPRVTNRPNTTSSSTP